MDNQVRFEEESTMMPPVRPHSSETQLVQLGAVVNPGQAQIVMAFFLAAAVAGAIYLIASAVPPPPELGNDVLRPGERVPTNRSL